MESSNNHGTNCVIGDLDQFTTATISSQGRRTREIDWKIKDFRVIYEGLSSVYWLGF